MTKLVSALFVSALLTIGCVPPRLVVPNPTVVHQVAERGTLVLYLETADGKLVPTKVEIPAGWWVAGPPVVESMP